MSILIRDMEMPRACVECVFYRWTDPIYDYCCISSVAPQNYIPQDCPLIELPPHGRLIDADGTEAYIKNLQDTIAELVEELEQKEGKA